MKKKAIFLSTLFGIGMFFAACSSDSCHNCTIGSASSADYCEADYTQAELDALQESCEFGGGTWN